MVRKMTIDYVLKVKLIFFIFIIPYINMKSKEHNYIVKVKKENL